MEHLTKPEAATGQAAAPATANKEDYLQQKQSRAAAAQKETRLLRRRWRGRYRREAAERHGRN
ncbi:MAG: hypothetical protein ACLR23_23150 [Clostridia bacterium]